MPAISPSARPFGEPDSESEYEQLRKEGFSELFFEETAFNKPALLPETYLIVGRRGSGKTALNHYFQFQREIPNCRAIDVDEPDVFQRVMGALSKMPDYGRDVRLDSIAKVWEYVIWCLVFSEFQDLHADIKGASLLESKGPWKSVFRAALKLIVQRVLKAPDDEFMDSVEECISQPVFLAGKEAALGVAKDTPIIVSIDSLEQYDIADRELMDVIAGLVQCATVINRQHASAGVHVKVFLSGEVYPHLIQSVIVNPLKYAKSPVYLIWRNKDLMRLIAWRLYKYLNERDLLLPESKQKIRWNDFTEVRKCVWEPYFGESLVNDVGITETTFPYLTRHTHMRPRQMIVLCNHVAQEAIRNQKFPIFEPKTIRKGLKRAEIELANGVINSYASIYPGVSDVVSVLSGMPAVFRANELDRRAPQSKPHWPGGDYSPLKFRRLLTELGVVGRVRSRTPGHVSVDFEYSLQDPLEIDAGDECAIHPMFYGRLNAQPVEAQVVYPFLHHDETPTGRFVS